MAGILQLRRGLKSTYISEGTNLAEAFFVTTAETGSISANNLIVGISGSVGNDVITLAKLSLANKDNSYADYNSGSFWITGDYTGSNALIHKNLIVSGNTYMEGDLHLEGHLFLGSGSDDDVVRVQSEFSGSLIPDNDITGSLTADADTSYYTLGNDAKRWKNLFLQSNSATGSNANGFISASHIDLTGRIWADGEGRFGTLRLDDITDNRVLLAGTNGRVIDDANLTYDGQDFRLSNSDYYQIGTGASFQFDGAGMDITGSISNYQLRVDNGIVFTNAVGTLDNQSQFTWDGGLLNIDGGISASQNLSVDGETTLASAIVKDLTENRIVIAGPVGEIEDDQYFRYTGNEFIIGSDEHFKVVTLTGNTFISGAVQMFSTLNVDDQSTLASANIEDLTDNRVVIVGTGGELEDDGNFTFDGTELNIGTGNFTVQQGSGNTHIVGDVDIDSDLNVDGGDITTNQSTFNLLNGNATTVNAFGASTTINIGTGGAGGGETSINHDLSVTGNTTISGNLTVSGTTTQLDVTNLNVEDKNILIASGSVNSAAADGAGITIDGANQTLTYDASSGRMVFNDSLEVSYAAYIDTIYRRASDNEYISLDNGQINIGIGGTNTLTTNATETHVLDNLLVDGDLVVEGNISGSSFNGTTLLSSSNENFADYSQSVDSRLDYLEGPFSTSVDSRLDDTEWTGSNHEQRIDSIESISGSLLYSASNDFSEITLNRIDGTTLEVDATPRKVIESVINKNGFMAKGTPVYVSGSTGNALHVFAASASRVDRMPATFILDQDLASEEEGYGILGGFINGVDTSLFEEGDNVYVGANGGYTNSRPTGSNIQVQKLGNVIKKAVNGSGVITGAGRSNDVPNIQEGYLWVGNGDGVAAEYTTSSLIPQGTVSGSDQLTGSFASFESNTFNGTQTISGSVNITNVLNLASNDPLPGGSIGDLAVSGSNLYFYNGSWTQVI